MPFSLKNFHNSVQLKNNILRLSQIFQPWKSSNPENSKNFETQKGKHSTWSASDNNSLDYRESKLIGTPSRLLSRFAFAANTQKHQTNQIHLFLLISSPLFLCHVIKHNVVMAWKAFIHSWLCLKMIFSARDHDNGEKKERPLKLNEAGFESHKSKAQRWYPWKYLIFKTVPNFAQESVPIKLFRVSCLSPLPLARTKVSLSLHVVPRRPMSI